MGDGVPLSGSDRCLAWSRYVNHGGGGHVGPDDYSKPMEVEGVRILEDLKEYMVVERALMRLSRESRRKPDRMRRLLLWVHHEGRGVGEFRTFEVGRGFPFELVELGETEEGCLWRLLERFYGMVEEIAAGEK